MKYIFFFVICAASASLARGQTFTWQHPLPAGNDLRCAVVLPSGIRFVAGDAGTLLRSTDGGLTWVLSFADSSVGDITDAAFPDEPVGYVCTSRGQVFKTTDAGASWIPLGTLTAAALQSVDFLTADTGMVVGTSGTILRTADGGNSWSPSALSTSATLYRVHYVNASTAYIGTPSASPGRLLRTTDGGVTWNPVAGYTGTGSVRGISFPTPDTGWVATALYEIFRTTNGGASFTLQADPGAGLFYDIRFLNASVGVAAGSRGDVFVTTNSGAVWTPSPMGYVSPLYCVAVRDLAGENEGPVVMTGGSGGALATSTNMGATWTTHTQALTRYDLREVQFIDENLGYAVGGSSAVNDSTGVILKTVNGGTIWTLLPFNPKHRVYSTCWLDAQTGFISSIGPDGVWKTTDGGETFSRQRPGLGVESSIWYSIRFLNSNVGFVAGSAGFLAKTTDGGSTWNELTSGHGLSAIYHIFLIDSQHAVTTGGSGRVYRTTDGGAYWYPIGIGGSATVNSSWWANRDTGFVSGSSGTISMTTNRGLDWSERSTGTTANFYRIIFSDRQHGWACGSLGSIFHSTDGGEHWIRAATLSTSKTLYGLDVKEEGLHSVGTDAVILFAALRPLGIEEPAAGLPDEAMVSQNYPNPFNPETSIRYVVPFEAKVTLAIYDLLGREVRTLIDEVIPPGGRSCIWDARNEFGVDVAGGVYFYKLTAIDLSGTRGRFRETRKMLLLR